MIESRTYPGRCLDSNGNVYMLPCQPGNNYQDWLMEFQSINAIDGHDQVKFENAATGLLLSQWRSMGPVLGALPRNNSNPRQVFDGVGPNWSNVQLRPSHIDATAGWGLSSCFRATDVGRVGGW